ncbi:MAG: hypothetical protein CMP47_00495 [Rickettsiales bacterium]|nr:hypothetical protein [Rickettsiales bacterium]
MQEIIQSKYPPKETEGESVSVTVVGEDAGSRCVVCSDGLDDRKVLAVLLEDRLLMKCLA